MPPNDFVWLWNVVNCGWPFICAKHVDIPFIWHAVHFLVGFFRVAFAVSALLGTQNWPMCDAFTPAECCLMCFCIEDGNSNFIHWSSIKIIIIRSKQIHIADCVRPAAEHNYNTYNPTSIQLNFIYNLLSFVSNSFELNSRPFCVNSVTA